MATIDLSQLPAPDVVEALDYETLLNERKATLVSLYPAEQHDAVARTLALESEPVVKLLQENAYREVILRQRVNEAAKAVMVAYALADDLDQLGANNGVTRLTLTAADDTTTPPTAAVMESDDDYRVRIAAAFEGLSVAGPSGAYGTVVSASSILLELNAQNERCEVLDGRFAPECREKIAQKGLTWSVGILPY